MNLSDEERRWLDGLAKFDEGNELAFLAICAGFRKPKTYLDIGCGTGAMVKIARQLGIDAYGVDILPHDEPYLLQQDLRTFCDLGKRFDLVTSIEVAEHIAPESMAILCDSYARHVRPDGGLFVLTSAQPGQVGDGHLNCISLLVWRDELETRGLIFDAWATNRLKALWREVFMCTHWLVDNVQVFRTGDGQ